MLLFCLWQTIAIHLMLCINPECVINRAVDYVGSGFFNDPEFRPLESSVYEGTILQ